MKAAGVLVAAVGSVLTVLLTMLSASTLGLTTMTSGNSDDQPSRHAQRDIPRPMLLLYQRAAVTCPGLSWTVLAAIGKAETDHGRATDQVSPAGAVGPMQFLPATFRAYGHPRPPGGAAPPTPWDKIDAVYAAARLLCRNGARHGRHIRQAIHAYNHSGAYVTHVLRTARSYRDTTAATIPPIPAGPGSQAGRAAVTWALTQRGKPYVWGAEGPGSYDCSGLTMRAWQHAGIGIPRTTYQQWHIGRPVARTRLQAGDLVFFNPGASGPEHVGLYLGHGQMVEAPHTGDVVKTASITRSDYLGARRPTSTPAR